MSGDDHLYLKNKLQFNITQTTSYSATIKGRTRSGVRGGH